MTEGEAFDRMAAYCASAEHCRSEVAEKMQRWGVDYGVVEHVVERLVCEKYIDEDRYCRAFVNDKFRLEKWGKRKIREALSVKKIKEVYVDAALMNISDEDYMAALRSVLKSQERSLHGMDEEVRREKLYRFAQSRGYEAAAISECLG